nr:secreted RxLR effector protein 161-like [Ziziphus jujuba var. spinosa]
MNNVPYSSAIGSVMYLMISTRPDLAYAISILSRFMSNPGRGHGDVVKWLMRYLKFIMHEGLLFKGSQDEVELLGYTDADYAGDRDKRKSISAYGFTVCGNCVRWKSHLQPVVALSTTEAEYMAMIDAAKEAIWIKGLLVELGALDKTVVIYSDNQSAIHLCKNPVFHERSKHIQIKYHFIRDMVERKEFQLNIIPTELHPIDMGTKILPREQV